MVWMTLLTVKVSMGAMELNCYCIIFVFLSIQHKKTRCATCRVAFDWSARIYRIKPTVYHLLSHHFFNISSNNCNSPRHKPCEFHSAQPLPSIFNFSNRQSLLILTCYGDLWPKKHRLKPKSWHPQHPAHPFCPALKGHRLQYRSTGNPTSRKPVMLVH